jgi:hypothetical protein
MANRPTERVLSFYSRARIRSKRRHSPWNLVLIPVGLAGWLGTWYGLFRIVWAFHRLLYPQHAFRDFWTEGISFTAFVPSFLMLFAPAFGSLCFGLVLANCVAWLVPPARRALDAESSGYPGTGFTESTTLLLKLFLWTLPSGVIIAMLAATVLRSMH